LYRGVHQSTSENTYIPRSIDYAPVNNEVAVGLSYRFYPEPTLRILL
jgi:hypothetical protein